MALGTAPGPPQFGGTAPAMPGQVDKGGKEARGQVVAGLGMELMRLAIPLLGNSELGLAVTEVVAKLGKKLQKPPEDLGQAEMKFMQSSLYPKPQANAMQAGPQIQQQLAGAGVPGAAASPPAPGGAGPGG